MRPPNALPSLPDYPVPGLRGTAPAFIRTGVRFAISLYCCAGYPCQGPSQRSVDGLLLSCSSGCIGRFRGGGVGHSPAFLSRPQDPLVQHFPSVDSCCPSQMQSCEVGLLPPAVSKPHFGSYGHPYSVGIRSEQRRPNILSKISECLLMGRPLNNTVPIWSNLTVFKPNSVELQQSYIDVSTSVMS